MNLSACSDISSAAAPARLRQVGLMQKNKSENAHQLQGMYKVVFGHMVQTFGFTYTKSMNPSITSVVIAGNVKDDSSAKVKTALK